MLIDWYCSSDYWLGNLDWGLRSCSWTLNCR